MYFICIIMFSLMFICASWDCLLQWKTEREPDSMKQKLPMILSQYVNARKQTCVFCSSNECSQWLSCSSSECIFLTHWNDLFRNTQLLQKDLMAMFYHALLCHCLFFSPHSTCLCTFTFPNLCHMDYVEYLTGCLIYSEIQVKFV